MANLNDIIALAKAGYKVKEITKMIEDDKNKDKVEDASASIDDKTSLSTTNEPSTPDEDDIDVEVELVDKEDTTDYKSLYEEQKKQLEEAKKKLKIAQQGNVRQPVDNGKEMTEEEFYEDLANAFL